MTIDTVVITAEEKLFQMLISKEGTTVTKIIDLFWESLALAYQAALEEVNSKYPEVARTAVNSLQSMTYDGNQEDTEARIIKIFRDNKVEVDSFILSHEQVLLVFEDLMKIFENEMRRVREVVVYQKVRNYYDFYEVVSARGCCEHCQSYQGTIYPIIEWKQNHPPYHPLCVCYSIFYTKDDIRENEMDDLIDDEADLTDIE